MKMKRLIALFLLLVVALTACGQKKSGEPTAAPAATDAAAEAPSGEKAEPEEKDASGEPFRVGMEAGYVPFNWTQIDDSNGAVKIDGSAEYAGGYDVEIAKRVAEGLGRPLVIVKTEWDGLPPALLSGKIDAIIAGMSPLAERRETLDFTDSYYRSEFVVILRKDSKYAEAKSLDDFAGAKISAQLNTNHYDAIDQLPGVSKQDAMDSFNSLRMAVVSGKIDAYVAERPEALSVEAGMPELKAILFEEGKGFEVLDEDICVAVALRKDSDLKEKINSILAEISEEERQEIMEQALQNQPSLD
jgi:putative lysine transport system substrate-binding protein